ncbi:UNVERIFIED_CONTAM: hypothetical protein FKN15_055272 [Acipenser sinensis]
MMEGQKASAHVQRTINRGAIEELDKPSVICDYTSKMGAVDRADHYCASYAFTRKSLKWWRKMFFRLLEVAIVNSAILFNLMKVESGQLPVHHKTFRKALLIQLVGNVCNPGSRKRGRPSSTDREERLNGKPHFIAKNESKNTKDCAVTERQKRGGERLYGSAKPAQGSQGYTQRDWRLDTAGNDSEDPSGDGDDTTTRTADSERKARDTLRWEQAERPRGSVVRRHKDGGGLRRPQRADQESKWLTTRM